MCNLVLINPWVYDFSLYNLWSAPLGLYKVSEFLSQYRVNINIIDCLDAHIKEKPDGRSHIFKEKVQKPDILRKIPRFYYKFGINDALFKQKVVEIGKIDAFLITSHMSYWYTGVQEIVNVLNEIKPDVPVIIGGIYATLNHSHAEKLLPTAHICKGMVDRSLIELLNNFGIHLNETGPKKHWSDFIAVKKYAPIITCYGCPMRCSYCASHILNPKFTQLEPDTIFKEINHLYQKGVRHFAFYDDAILVNSERHFIPILERILNPPFTKDGLGDISFHTPVGIQSRFITPKIAKLMNHANFKYLRIGYETSNLELQKKTGGKICNEELKQGITYLKEAGFKGEDIGVFIMFGLPGQPFSEVIEAVNFVRSLNAKVVLTEYSPIIGTEEYKKTPDISDLLLTNNNAYSLLFCNYTKSDIDRLKLAIK